MSMECSSDLSTVLSGTKSFLFNNGENLKLEFHMNTQSGQLYEPCALCVGLFLLKPYIKVSHSLEHRQETSF